MDGAAGRVKLRGLRLLQRCRELRGEDAAREAARRRAEAEQAEADADRARAALRAHVASWRAQERELMQAAPGAALPVSQLAGRRRHLERLADEAVRLVEALDGAEELAAQAAAALDAARAILATRRREASKAAETADPADRQARRAAGTAEQREAENSATDRFAGARGGWGAPP